MRLIPLLLALALGACAGDLPTDSYCKLYERVLPDREEVGALKRPTKEAILANERTYIRDCTPGGLRPGRR